ncbi:MAG TPA: ARMT1-like domain-containing protein [Phycisphaerae bacterium]|nr:ARMT1-like domain-containing protein [Phycisphaerae bacterium]
MCFRKGTMGHFCLLSDPGSYVPLDWDLASDPTALGEWLDVFEKVFTEILQHAKTSYGRKAEKNIAAAAEQFRRQIESIRSDPASFGDGQLNVIALDRMRDRILRDNHIGDPFGPVKDRENALALERYPQVVRELHAMDGVDRWQHLVQCVFAGNIFDMGATSTLHTGRDGADFLAAVEESKPRPWLVDDFDALAERLVAAPPAPWAKAVVFVDNAGSDFILGVLPLVRELALCGTQIVLAANEKPSLNDITAFEITQLGRHLAAADDDLGALAQAGMLEVVSTGTDLPMIDLSDVSDELNDASADADLVILEGMGRAVETNFDAKFKVDTLRLALLKNETVARRLGGGLFDCVCKFTPAGS